MLSSAVPNFRELLVLNTALPVLQRSKREAEIVSLELDNLAVEQGLVFEAYGASFEVSFAEAF